MSDVPVAHVIDDEAPAPAAEGSDGGDGDSSEKPPSSSAGGGNGVKHFNWKKNPQAHVVALRFLDVLEPADRPWLASNKNVAWDKVAKDLGADDMFDGYSLSGKALVKWFQPLVTQAAKKQDVATEVYTRTGGEPNEMDEEEQLMDEEEELWISLGGKWNEDVIEREEKRQDDKKKEAEEKHREKLRADAVKRLVDSTRQGQASSLVMGDDGIPQVAAPSGSKDKRNRGTSGDPYDLTGHNDAFRDFVHSQNVIAEAKKAKVEEAARDGAHRRELELKRFEEDRLERERVAQERRQELEERKKDKEADRAVNTAMVNTLAQAGNAFAGMLEVMKSMKDKN